MHFQIQLIFVLCTPMYFWKIFPKEILKKDAVNSLHKGHNQLGVANSPTLYTNVTCRDANGRVAGVQSGVSYVRSSDHSGVFGNLSAPPPPSRQRKTFCAPPCKDWKLSAPPPPFRRGKTLRAPPLPFCSPPPLPVISDQSLMI